MRLAISLVLVALFACLAVVIGRGMIRSRALRSPRDDWAPLEAVAGRKFLTRTARSRRRWIRDAAGRERLLEATKDGSGYRITLDGARVEWVPSAESAESALARLAEQLSTAE